MDKVKAEWKESLDICIQYFWFLLSLMPFNELSTFNMPFLFSHMSALILEEIAIDCHNKETEQRLLQEAHDLHLSSLQLAKKAFGEFNVQTAKHYGNLGRLYQSMRKFKVTAASTGHFMNLFDLYFLAPLWVPIMPVSEEVCPEVLSCSRLTVCQLLPLLLYLFLPVPV